MGIRTWIKRLRFSFLGEADRIRLFDVASVGEDVRLTGWVDFGSEPFLVHLGSRITIADGVRFITHDGGVRVLRREHPDLHIYGKVSVSDNVFIGVNSIILPGVTIGSSCVIGAGSVVTKDLPPGGVYAGVPCKRIRSIAEYELSSVGKSTNWPVGNYGPEWREMLIEMFSDAERGRP